MATTTRQDKILGTIARVEKRLAKLRAMSETEIMKKYGYNDPSRVSEEENHHHAHYWHGCDIESAVEQLENNHRKLEEAKRLDEKADAKAKKEEIRHQTLQEAPETLKKFADTLCEEWTKWYIANAKKNHDWRSNEEIAKDCRKDADWLILDFMARTEKKCGKLTETRFLHIDNANWGICLNGWVKGEKGTARVESIVAGGYNIQCRHVRVLVK